MKPWIAALVLVALALAVYWFGLREPAAPPESPPLAALAPDAPGSSPAARPPAASPEPPPPEPPPPPAEALPPLADSDALVHEVLSGVVAEPLRRLLAPKDFVRRVVATVDNLPRETAAVRLWPVTPAPGLPPVVSDAGRLRLEPADGSRYAQYVALAETVDPDAVVAAYRRLYPLFQAAYRDLGYPDGNFNARLLAVIDHLLAAPEIDAPLWVVQPKVMYRFADPALQSLSAGHKIMVRIGTTNARRIKARLELLRERLTKPG